MPVQIAWYYVNEPNAPKTTTPSNIGHWLLIWINSKSVGGRGVCVCGGGDGVYPRQVILRPAHTHTQTQRERENAHLCMYMDTYLAITLIIHTEIDITCTIQHPRSDRHPSHSSNCIPIPCMIHTYTSTYKPAWYIHAFSI